jgi:hypothetical protein
MLLAAGLLLAPVAVRSQEAAFSQAAYVKFDCVAGQYRIASFPLEPLRGTACAVPDIFGTNNLPDGLALLFFNGTNYNAEEYYDGYGWWPGTNEVKRGSGFWMMSYATTSIVLRGRIPTNTSTSIGLPTNYWFVSFPYPIEKQLTNSALNGIAHDGDILLRWSVTNWTGAAYDGEEGGWLPTDFKFKVGEGYWYKSVAATNTWIENKPYAVP